MAYIYQITNDVNGKIYIGKTEFSIEKRFKEHCRDRNRRNLENRPLYRAMNKYGIEHFHIKLLEETDNPEEREVYWIEQMNSYHNGYNATMGGDGKRYLDYDKIVAEYLICHNQKMVAQKFNIDESSVHRILKLKNIPICKTPTQRKQVNQYTKDKILVQNFESCTDGARWLIAQNITQAQLGTVVNKITECANQKRKSAYGFIWEFI